jgi:hypothetical protein
MAGQLLVRILRQHQAGSPQDCLRIHTGRTQHVDRVVDLATRHDEPVIVGQDDASPVLGVLGEPPSARSLARTGRVELGSA